MKPALGLLLFLGMVPLAAQEMPMEPATLLAIDGLKTWAVPINGQAVAFYLPKAHRRVTISARLGNGGGHAYADAFLMKQIGPKATEADELGRVSFDLTYPFDGWVDLFSGVDLEEGRYWLVIARPHEAAHSSINWFVAQPMALSGSCDVRFVESQSYEFRLDAAEYIPASKFEKKYQPYAFQFELWEMRPPGEPPICGTGS